MPCLEQRHHYIPVFYLKQWLTGDGRICEYRKHESGFVKPKRKHPSRTGYVRGLYNLVGFEDPELREALEREFMSPVDSAAAVLLQDFKAGRRTMNNPAKRLAWTKFMLSLLFRTPEDIKLHREQWARDWMTPTDETRAAYKSFWVPGAPETVEEFLALTDPQDVARSALRALIPLINNPHIGRHVTNMQWGSLMLPIDAPALLTSDRPMIVSNGLNKIDSHIFLPIGPKHIFYAVNDVRAIEYLRRMRSTDLSKFLNYIVVSQAVEYVYGQWDVHLDFVREHVSTRPVPSLFQRMIEFQTALDSKRAQNGNQKTSRDKRRTVRST